MCRAAKNGKNCRKKQNPLVWIVLFFTPLSHMRNSYLC